MAIKVAGGVSNTLAEVSIRNQLKIQPEVDAENNPSHVGAVKIFTENDSGSLTGTPYIKSPEVSPDFRQRVGIDTLLFEDTFNATAQNTSLWSYTFATLTAAQLGAGTVNFSTVQGTTSAHGANMRTFQYFPLTNTAPLAIEFTGGSFVSPMVSGEVWAAGIGLPGSAILLPTDGIYWKLTTAGLEGILSFNNTPVSTGVIYPFSSIVLDTMAKYVIVIGEREIEFWVNDVFLGHLDIPNGNAVPWLGVSAPIFMMKYNTGAVSNTNQIRVARVGVTLLDVASNRAWGVSLATMGRHASTGQNGHTIGTTAGNYSGTSAIAATQAGSNTAANASFAGLGGIFQMTAAAGTAAGSGDLVASYYLNPASTINITGRNLIITKCKINAVNYGAVVATTPTTLVWGLFYGSTAITLAQAESASFTTATAHAPRKIPLGINYVPVGAVVGQPYSAEVGEDFTVAPIVVRPGEYIGTTVRFLVGTATASQTVVYTVTFGGYWE